MLDKELLLSSLYTCITFSFYTQASYTCACKYAVLDFWQINQHAIKSCCWLHFTSTHMYFLSLNSQASYTYP